MLASPSASAKPAASEKLSCPNTEDEIPTCQPSKALTEVRIWAEFGRTDLFGPRSTGGAGAALASWADSIATATVARATICVSLVICLSLFDLLEDPPTVHVDRLAGNIFRFLRGEESYYFPDIP